MARRNLIILAGILVLGIVFSIQGWRGRSIDPDFVVPLYETEALLTTGKLPDRGNVTSFGAYAPPGTAWLFVPGLLTGDPHLYQAMGSIPLYVLTGVGIYLLTSMFLSPVGSLTATALWAFSSHGLYFAQSLWAVGHPVWYVWLSVFAFWWVHKREAKWLGAALLTWMAGMYVFMTIAPAVLILPVLWALYRPPVRIRAIAPFVVVGLLIWSPYLAFQAQREWVDLKAQLLRVPIPADNYRALWCDPDAVITPALGYDIFGFVRTLGLLFVALLAVVVVYRKHPQLVIVLLVPTAFLILTVEPERPERFWWISTAQVIVITTALWQLRGRLRGSLLALFVAITLVVAHTPAGSVATTAQRWSMEGWSGEEAPYYRALAEFADHAKAEGAVTVSLGYTLPSHEWLAKFRAYDPRYGVGMHYDYLLHVFGVENENTCPEGFSASNEYRMRADDDNYVITPAT